jgi:TRAP-type C4-dicarboxylate transport system substrate-binding protein
VLVVSKRTWDKLPPDQQQVLRKLGDEFSQKGWDMGKRTDKEGIDKNREKGMEFVPATPAMTAAVKDIMTKVVLPNWLKRAGPDAKPIFNQYLAPYSVLTLP